jgi:poly(3-hydroxybutyrate) depolymerase
MAHVRVESPSLDWSYDATIEVPVAATGARFRRTRRSAVDGSTQYAAIMPPANVLPGETYGLILSLHGASVEASGQAASYSQKDWAYLVAPTNRRPFGFDWEEWGRLDALEALDDAQARFDIDPLRVHLTGHSMGGHGAWHLGVHFGDRFAVVAPSAGWISFDTYVGPPTPPLTTPVARARAASQTLDYIDNFAPQTVYIVHGSADDNVPVSQAREMFQTLGPITPDLTYHEEPGAGHWWDLDRDEEGADCVDWEPMIATMEATDRVELPLDFSFKTPSPWVSATHSFVTVRSEESPMTDASVESSVTGDVVTLTTSNVRSLVLDGAALAAAGVTSASVDGVALAVTPGPLLVGPEDGKTPDQHGPLNQVFHRPFCFVWQDDGSTVFRDYAAWLLSWWTVLGNGHGCGVPLSRKGEIASTHNLIYLGIPSADLDASLPIQWDSNGVTVDGTRFDGAAVFFVYPDGEKLAAYVSAPAGSEQIVYRWLPFTSRTGMPDFFVRDSEGTLASGFFDATWQVDPAFAVGL